jgi:AraC family transcriptional regulator of adaptative response / DNA-3-methyladenine glycosylase II
VEIQHLPDAQSLSVSVRTARVEALPQVVNRIRRVFDLAADVTAIGAHLVQDPLLAPLFEARPGLRVPGGWDGFELGVRAVLGQQVSVGAGRQLGEKLVRLCGTPVLLGPALTRVFPRPEQVVQGELSQLGMPRARIDTLLALARAAIDDPCLFEPRTTLEQTVERLCAVRGIGAWTAQYIALRGARDPDAFPASDRGLLRGIARCDGQEWSADALERHAERWRPWRAYAAQHLWAADGCIQAAPKRAVVRARSQRISKEVAYGSLE